MLAAFIRVQNRHESIPSGSMNILGISNMKQFSLLLFPFLLMCGCIAGANFKYTGSERISTISIGSVPSSFPVNFSLFTSGSRQYAAYYDSSHQLTLASRELHKSIWDMSKLDSKVGWDSHNYLSLILDDEGYIHLVGNMHSSPLVYFRSTLPFDIHSMQAIHTMTGKDEEVTTYPVFMRGPKGELLFHYRYGRSGSGYEIFNLWDAGKRQWKRLLDTPLTDGRGLMNAYMQGPLLGPDGWYHLLWVWRNSPDCATNHTLSYARSKDLLHWESIRSEGVKLPITLEDNQLVIDTTSVNGGLINIGIKIGFDKIGKILIGYHKYDSLGNTQLFLARFRHGAWIHCQVTHWGYRWDFKGVGTIVNELLIEPPRFSSKIGTIVFGYHHIKYGDGQIVINDDTLEPVETQPIETTYPKELDSLRSPFPGMVVNKVFDAGNAPAGEHYLLRWETLSPNRDQQRQENMPTNSLLELVCYE
ncbi:MAG: hypothetical protein EHM64_15570 [Ignavibacteriae bacterium]|nr:MAG: hypothetical protein EHM64_15570 [Ignavibacteriota bacterium]